MSSALRTVSTDTAQQGYAIGEEVVARLGRASVFDPRLGQVLVRKRMPSWTIGRVIHCEGEPRPRRYALTFRHKSAQYLCAVDEEAIEGTA